MRTRASRVSRAVTRGAFPEFEPLARGLRLFSALFPVWVSGCAEPVTSASAPGHGPSAPALECTLDGSPSLEPLSRTSSSVTLGRAAGRTIAFVADEDTSRLVAVDLDARKELAALELGSPPASVLASPSGRLAVTVPARSEVAIVRFDGERLTRVCSVPAPAEPVALAFAPDRRTLFVASAWGHALTAYASAGLKQTARLELPREPRAVAVADDGARAFVSHGVGSVLSVVDLSSWSSQAVSLDSPLPPHLARRRQSLRDALAKQLENEDDEKRQRTIANLERQLLRVDRSERVSNQGFAFALSVDPPGRVLLPGAFVDPGSPDQVSQGYGRGSVAAVTPVVAVIDANKLEPAPRSVEPPAAWINQELIAGREGCRLPRAAAIDPESGLLLVTCVGSDVLIGYDAASPSPIDAEVLRVRVPAGPTGLGIDVAGRRAVVFSQFERTLSSVPLPRSGEPLGSKETKPAYQALAPVPGRGLSDKLELGRRLFHASDDPRIARDGRACASCHVAGRDDGLVWSTPNGPRRTKTLAAMMNGTAPYSWDGAAETLRDQVEETFDRLDARARLKDFEVDALLAYVRSLPAPPRRSDDVEQEKLAQGRRVFLSSQAGCAGCHTGVRGTDGTRHEVSSDTPVDQTARFDTPSLGFLEGRAPYFHDGRYQTLRQLLTASDGKMGNTAHLSATELDALELYLETL